MEEENNSITLLDGRVQASRTGLVFDDGITYPEWELVGTKLKTIEGAVHWWIGDWLNFGEFKWGEKYAQAIDHTGYEYSTVAHDKWVSSAIEFCRRRQNLSWSHHAEVASLLPVEQDKFLDLAGQYNWTRQRTRQEVYTFTLTNEIEKRKKQLGDGNNPELTLYAGDSTAVLKTIPDASIDLIIADPPYNMDKAEWDSLGSGSQFAMWCAEWLIQCKRILKDNGSIYIFGINRMLSHLQHLLDGMGMLYRNWIIWDIIQGPGGGLWANRYEAILYYSKTDKAYEDSLSIRLERDEQNIREYKGVEYEFRNPSNIWRFPRVDDSSGIRYEHPTQKPVQLIERMILANSYEGCTILDPFVGSGTSAIAALKNKRKFIGIDINPEYIELTRYRVTTELS